MKNNNAKQEYMKRHYTEFINPVLMSLYPYETSDRDVIKNINEIESDACEILDISNEERRAYYNDSEIRILRSKLKWGTTGEEVRGGI